VPPVRGGGCAAVAIDRSAARAGDELVEPRRGELLDEKLIAPRRLPGWLVSPRHVGEAPELPEPVERELQDAPGRAPRPTLIAGLHRVEPAEVDPPRLQEPALLVRGLGVGGILRRLAGALGELPELGVDLVEGDRRTGQVGVVVEIPGAGEYGGGDRDLGESVEGRVSASPRPGRKSAGRIANAESASGASTIPCGLTSSTRRSSPSATARTVAR